MCDEAMTPILLALKRSKECDERQAKLIEKLPELRAAVKEAMR